MINMKRISDSYLFQVADQNKQIFEYLMKSERVDKNSNGFQDIVYGVKKQASSVILKVLYSDKVILMMDPSGKGTSRLFKVIYSKDPKDQRKKHRVFIDCTGIIKYENGVYTCNKISTLISYLTAAIMYIVYYNMPEAIINSTTLMKHGTSAFIDLVLYVLGYLKIPVTYADTKERISFVLGEYFLSCVVGIDYNSDRIYNIAKQASGITEKRTCDYLHTLFASTFDDGKASFDQFLKKFSEVFIGKEDISTASPKNRTPLTVDAFSQRWMYAYGSGTVLGLECFVPFAQILTDCYNGAFINQQNTIEKVVGTRVITGFSNEILKIGSENA